MSKKDVSITTPDGEARAYAFTPDQGAGPWPGVMVYMDALAIRPAMFEMAQRVADHGYFVLLPDMFWRRPPYEPFDIPVMLSDRSKLMEFMGSTNPQKAMSDTGAFLGWLSDQPQVKGEKVGTTGYCMGGGMSLRAAAAYPDRVAAAAAFHAGNVVTDAPDSVHKVAPTTKAKVLVAGADEDKGFTSEARDILAKAYKDAGVDADVSIWPGKLHGYAPRDMPVYDKEASERHFKEMFALFDGVLK